MCARVGTFRSVSEEFRCFALVIDSEIGPDRAEGKGEIGGGKEGRKSNGGE